MHKSKVNGNEDSKRRILNSKIFFLLLLNFVFLQFFSVVGIASATTYYVSPAGNDVADGMSIGTAWGTIQHAADTMIPGDTVRVQAGTYNEQIIITRSGTSNNWITFTTDGTVILDRIDKTGVGISMYGKSYIKINGFKITRYFQGIYADAIGAINTHHVNVTNVIVSNTAEDGIQFRTNVNNIFINNVDVSFFGNHGILIFGFPYDTAYNNNITIINSKVHDNTADTQWHNAIDIHTNVGDVLLQNNTIYNIAGAQAGMYIHNWNVTRVKILNNFIHDTAHGIEFIGVNDSVIDGNRIETIERYPIAIFQDSASTPGSYNLTFKNNTIKGQTAIYEGCVWLGKISSYNSENKNILFQNNTFSGCALSDFAFENDNNNNISIIDQNGKTIDIWIKTYANPISSKFQYTNGKIFTEDDTDNIPYWYQNNSTIKLVGSTGHKIYTVYNSTLNTTGKVTVTSFSTSNMILDYYNQNISIVNFTLADSVSSFNITLINVPSGLNLFLYDARNLIDNKIASSGTVYFNVGLSDGSYYIKLGADGPYGNGSGTVINKTSSAPIVGATITDGVKTTTTDGLGNFFLANILNGSRTITASKTGYQTASKLVTVIENSTVTVDFQLDPLIPPIITFYTPSDLTPSQDEGTTNTFIVTVDQPVTNKWFLDNIEQPGISQTYTKTWSYSEAGTHNITYSGENANGTVSKTWIVTVNNVADITPPVISGMGSSITSSSATITWTTNEPATSQVEYGLTSGYGSSTSLDPTLMAGHSVTLTGLNSNTTYHYRVKSTDADNNQAISSDYSFNTLTADPATVGLWHLDEGSSNIAADSSGNNNNGTIYGASWTAGKLGSALQFNGNAYVSIPNSASLNPVSEITIEAWFKPTSIPQAGWNKIIAKPYTSYASPYQQYALSLSGDKVVFELNAGGAKDAITSSLSLSSNTWYHLAGTYDGTEMRIYVDGVLNGTLPKSGSIASYPTNVNIGAGIYSDRSVEYINGNVDEVKILSRALSALEVKADYEAGTLDNIFTQPTVTNPSSSPSTISDDTDNDPRWGESSRLNVTVTSSTNIASVTIDFSAIGGSPVQPMANIGGNIWSVMASAYAGTPPQTYDLMVNATDINGNSSTSVGIPLTVMRNGDTNGNGAVNIADAMLLANYAAYPGQYSISSSAVADVTGDGSVNIADAMYLANYATTPGYILH